MASDKLVWAIFCSSRVPWRRKMMTWETIKGRTINFDYQAWAKDKVFNVDDRLVLNYTPPHHNMFKLNATAFRDCTIPPANEAMKSGRDIVEICGIGEHCTKFNQKLIIDVVATSPTPAPKPHAPAPAPFFHIAAPAKPRTPAFSQR